jgi:hypothetical protein
MQVKNDFPSFILRSRVHPDPNRLFDHADALISNHQDETDLRRAVSAAYYGVFHFTLRALADWIVGSANRSTDRYALVYRSVDHKVLRALCDKFRGATLNADIQPYEPTGGFGPLGNFARALLNLFELRILADYNPVRPLSHTDALGAVSSARPAVANFQAATPAQREAFLTLLAFRAR